MQRARERRAEVLESKASRVCSLRRKHPRWTLRQIGEKVGMSHEWVRQQLEAAGLPTRRANKPLRVRKCPECGKEHRKPNTITCSRECGDERRRRYWKRRKCKWSSVNTVRLKCSACGKKFDRPRKIEAIRDWQKANYGVGGDNRKNYCSRRCYLERGKK